MTPQEERGKEAGDEEEHRPGFRSGQTGQHGHGHRHRHRREARGRSRRAPVIRENGQEGRRAHSFVSPRRYDGFANPHTTTFHDKIG